MSLIVPKTLTETDPVFSAAPASGIVAGDISNWNTAYGWGDHAVAGYLTSFTETDPVFGASPAAGITAPQISNWNTAYGWGNHAAAGYLDDYEEGTWTPTVNGITVTGNVGRYRKIGSFVIAAYALTFPSSSNTGRIQIQGLPFTNMNDGAGGANLPNFGAALGYTNQGTYFGHHVNNNSTTVDAYKLDGTDAQITQWSTKQIRNVIFYFTE